MASHGLFQIGKGHEIQKVQGNEVEKIQQREIRDTLPYTQANTDLRQVYNRRETFLARFCSLERIFVCEWTETQCI